MVEEIGTEVRFGLEADLSTLMTSATSVGGGGTMPETVATSVAVAEVAVGAVGKWT